MARPYVIVAPDFVLTGGMDRANYALAQYLARRGHETPLASFQIAPELAAEPNVRAHVAPLPWGKKTLGGPFLGALGIAQSLTTGPDAELIVNGGNCPYPGAVNWVHYVHAADAHVRRGDLGPKNAIARATERIALGKARLVLADSDRTRMDLALHLGIDDAKIKVVYYGIDAAAFRPRTDDERAAIRATLGWPAERLKAIFVGALGDTRKGFQTLYAAWRSLCRAPDWDVDLVVIGRGRRVEEFRARARTDGLSDRIEFLGFRSDVPLVVGASDLLIAPSLYEAYGLAVHEALCSGVPAITSARAGVAEVYPESLADWLLPDPADDVDLAARIRRWRALAPARPDALGPLSDRLRQRDWNVMSAEIVARCEA